MFRTSRVYTMAVTRTVPRHVRCEHCGAEYVYELTRTATGEAGWGLESNEDVVKGWAVDAAFKNVAAAVDSAADAVPCPACLKYQSHMLPAARRLRWGWAGRLAENSVAALPILAVVVVVACVAAGAGTLAYTIVAAIAAVLLATAGVFYWLPRFGPVEPNGWPEAFRAAHAKESAVTREDFAKLVRDGGLFGDPTPEEAGEELEDVEYLWVLPEELKAGAAVPFYTHDGRTVEVQLSPDDDEGFFLDETRVRDPLDEDAYRICLHVFNVYRPTAKAEKADSEAE